jgi:ectoine hydroxylase-related dioxygenase (phytanoyl-CoA dioxygenase family)
VLWNKAANAGTALPWHQDDGKFWGIDRAPFLQVWTALDDARENGACIEVLPGSHKGGLASPEGGTVRDSELQGASAEQRKVMLNAKAGDTLLLHNHVWHRSGTNEFDHPRRAISISFLCSRTRCLRKRRAPRTFMRLFQAGTRSVQQGEQRQEWQI